MLAHPVMCLLLQHHSSFIEGQPAWTWYFSAVNGIHVAWTSFREPCSVSGVITMISGGFILWTRETEFWIKPTWWNCEHCYVMYITVMSSTLIHKSRSPSKTPNSLLWENKYLNAWHCRKCQWNEDCELLIWPTRITRGIFISGQQGTIHNGDKTQ